MGGIEFNHKLLFFKAFISFIHILYIYLEIKYPEGTRCTLDCSIEQSLSRTLLIGPALNSRYQYLSNIHVTHIDPDSYEKLQQFSRL